jgi:hypothetical protein
MSPPRIPGHRILKRGLPPLQEIIPLVDDWIENVRPNGDPEQLPPRNRTHT